jgi:hypothetical protein
MSDYSESGARPVDDAAVDDPPTEGEVRAAQERNYPEQAATRVEGVLDTAPDDGMLDRHPDAGELPSETQVQAERQVEGESAADDAARRADHAHE